MKELNLVDLSATEALGVELGKLLQPGDCLVLTGKLGTGKTTLTKGIAKGLGIKKIVKSPTYTIVREYHEGRLPLYHMDVYRLSEGDGTELGLEEYFHSEGVSIIEWGQILGEDLPLDYLEIKLFYSSFIEERKVELKSVGERSKSLLDELKS